MLVAPTKFFHELSPPYCSLQIVTKYRYKYNNYVTVSTIIQPVSGDLSKIYKSIDVRQIIGVLGKLLLSSLRMTLVTSARQ